MLRPGYAVRQRIRKRIEEAFGWMKTVSGLRKTCYRGTFESLKRLESAIRRYIDHWNENPRPFRWTRSAADIQRSLDTVTAIYETAH
jgi:cobalamin biosynthesis Mg chelatase CobN